MKRKNRKIIGAVALIAALAAGGVAFTAGQTLPTDTAGYGHVSVTGGFNVDDISNTLNAMGTEVTSDQLTFHSLYRDTVTAGFDDATALDRAPRPDQTVYACAVTHASGVGNFEPTAGSAGFAVAVPLGVTTLLVGWWRDVLVEGVGVVMSNWWLWPVSTRTRSLSGGGS